MASCKLLCLHFHMKPLWAAGMVVSDEWLTDSNLGCLEYFGPVQCITSTVWKHGRMYEASDTHQKTGVLSFKLE